MPERMSLNEIATDILEIDAWFNGLDPSMKDALSEPNHNYAQAQRAVQLARAVLATPDRPAQVTAFGRPDESHEGRS